MADVKIIKDGIEYVPIEPTYTGNVIGLIYDGKTHYFKPIKKEKDIPKDWEIINYLDTDCTWCTMLIKEGEMKYHNYPIHSVKRLSDGEVFTVGDEIKNGKIKRFYIWETQMLIETDRCNSLSLKYQEKDKPDWVIMARGARFINSVKRLSDNQIFNIGDFVQTIYENYTFNFSFHIRAFEIQSGNMMVISSDATKSVFDFKMIEKVNSKEPEQFKDWEIISFRNKDEKYHSCIFKWQSYDGGYVLNSTPYVCRSLEEMFSDSYGKFYEPLSIKRLNDGEIFTIGDMTNFNKILGFEIHGQLMTVLLYGNWQKLDAISKVKPKVPLFTIDGMNIFEGDEYVIVNVYNYTIIKVIAKYHEGIGSAYFKSFLNMENAKQWITENKPIEVSCKEVDSLFKGTLGYENFSAQIKMFFKSKINL